MVDLLPFALTNTFNCLDKSLCSFAVIWSEHLKSPSAKSEQHGHQCDRLRPGGNGYGVRKDKHESSKFPYLSADLLWASLVLCNTHAYQVQTH